MVAHKSQLAPPWHAVGCTARGHACPVRPSRLAEVRMLQRLTWRGPCAGVPRQQAPQQAYRQRTTCPVPTGVARADQRRQSIVAAAPRDQGLAPGRVVVPRAARVARRVDAPLLCRASIQCRIYKVKLGLGDFWQTQGVVRGCMRVKILFSHLIGFASPVQIQGCFGAGVLDFGFSNSCEGQGCSPRV